jgi:hypothetical protein
MSRFAAPKSEEARMQSLADDEAFAGLDEQDPASMERLMKHMGNEMGEEFADDMPQDIDYSDESSAGMGESDDL